MNVIFDRKMFKEKAKAQVSNVILIFLIFIGINLFLGYFMTKSPFQSITYIIQNGTNISPSYYKYIASGLIGTGLFSTILRFVLRAVEPYFETKACLYSRDNHQKVDVGGLFKSFNWDEFFSYFIKILIANLIVSAIMVVGILCLVFALTTAYTYSAYGMTMMSTRYVQYHTGLGTGSIILMLVCLCSAIATAFMHYRYALVPYIALEQPNNGIMATLKLSAETMQGFKWNLFVMDLSFIGWYFLVAITGGLLNIYVAPYHALATTEMYRTIKMPEGNTYGTDSTNPMDAMTAEHTQASSDTDIPLADAEEPKQDSFEIKYCPYCGSKLKDPNANFCTSCGKKLK